MTKGFFPESELTFARRTALSQVAQCGACGLHKGCLSPKMPVFGEGNKKILIVGEAPGKSEDIEGRPFTGKSGQLLQNALREFGVVLKRDCWTTNALRCRPKLNQIKDKRAIEYCRPNVAKAIKDLDPVSIILLGKNAIESVIGWCWREGDIGGITKWTGWHIPCQVPVNAWIHPTWHPSHLLRSEKERNYVLLNRKWKEHIGVGVSATQKPWKEIPDYKRKVKVIFSEEEASKEIKRIILANKPTVFDYETDRLKPDHKNSTIVCCGVSNGDATIAYPWLGKAIEATEELLLSEVPKIGANIKFDHRWTKSVLGIEVKNWLWDTMLATHCLDNRQSICSLKFQAFVQLGAESYDERIKPWLKPKNKESGSNAKNQIKEIALDKLLLYAGTDALLEWLLAEKQMKQMEG